MFFKEHLNFIPQMTVRKVLWRWIRIIKKKKAKLSSFLRLYAFCMVLLSLIAAKYMKYFVDCPITKLF